MLNAAWKSMLARKRRLVTTGFAIVLAVAFIAGTLVITNLIGSTLDGLISSTYQGVGAVVRSAKAQPNQFGQAIRPQISSSLVDLVRSARGVRAAEAVVVGLPMMLDRDGKRIEDTFGPPTLALNWIDDEGLAGGRLQPGGRAPRDADETVIDVRTARDYGFKVGDSISAQFPAGLRRLRIVGIGGVPTDGNRLAADRG
ncbi:MAG: hypothetical protein R2698_03655 [Microthrixaceae bacterium]